MWLQYLFCNGKFYLALCLCVIMFKALVRLDLFFFSTTQGCLKNSSSKCLTGVWTLINRERERMELNATEKRDQKQGADNRTFELEVSLIF